MFGTSTGTAEHIRNTGTNTAPAFTHATSTAPSFPWGTVEHPNPLGTIDVGVYSAPTCFNIVAECTNLAHCSAHGLCKHPSQCGCFDGWGSASDLTAVGFGGSKDCFARTCPSGNAWVDIPTAATVAHARSGCSNQGTCDRSSGKCKCYPGFTGDSCQRMKCPMALGQECLGHGLHDGQCISMKRMATMTTDQGAIQDWK
jgi:hypothetical protein